MPIRKNRSPGQGISNHSSLALLTKNNSSGLSAIDLKKTLTHKKTNSFNLSQSVSKISNLQTTMTEHNPFYFSGIEQKINQNHSLNMAGENQLRLHKKQFNPKPYQIQQSNNLSQNTAKVLDKIRSTYKYSAKIRKIAKGWGFENKGYISNNQFQEIMNKHFDSSISKQNCQEMLKSVGCNQQNIDIMTFVKLVFQQEPFTKPKINVLDNQQNLQKSKSKNDLSATLIQKISNLNEGSIVHNEVEKIDANKSFVLPHLGTQKSHSKLLNSSFMLRSQGFQRTQPSLHQTMHSTSSPKFNFSTRKSHGIEFSPTLFQNINQQKTRFGATPVIQVKDQSVLENKREKIFDSKERILEDLNSQDKIEKMRYMNKLELIRQHQQREKENILLIDRRAQERDNSNMRRLREQNLAYNYVNFLHNDWK